MRGASSAGGERKTSLIGSDGGSALPASRTKRTGTAPPHRYRYRAAGHRIGRALPRQPRAPSAGGGNALACWCRSQAGLVAARRGRARCSGTGFGGRGGPGPTCPGSRWHRLPRGCSTLWGHTIMVSPYCPVPCAAPVTGAGPARPGPAEPGTAAARAARGVSAAPPPPISAERGRDLRRGARNRPRGGVSSAHHVGRDGKVPVSQARRPRPPGGRGLICPPLGGAAGRGCGDGVSPCRPCPRPLPRLPPATPEPCPSPVMVTARAVPWGQPQPLLMSLSAACPAGSAPAVLWRVKPPCAGLPLSPLCSGLAPMPSPVWRGRVLGAGGVWGQRGTRMWSQGWNLKVVEGTAVGYEGDGAWGQQAW